jgi:hypothetical protein
MSNKRVSEVTDAEIREMAGCSPLFAFHGTNGETLTVRHDEDGVTVRTEFRDSKLSAAEARRLASHLTEYAEHTEAPKERSNGHQREGQAEWEAGA